MEPLRFAFRYFTNLPFPGEYDWNEKTAAASLSWLPLTGLAVGLCLAALGLFFQNIDFPQYPPLKAILIMALESWIGGSLLIRGFCASCEGLFSGLGTKRSLELIKDSRLGSAGALGLIFALLAKLLLLTELSMQNHFIYLLVFYPCWTRWAASFAACNYRIAAEEGMALFFKTAQRPVYLVMSSVFTMLLLVLTPRHFYLAGLVSFIALLFCCTQVQTRLGGQTEETYGLAAVTAELTFLLFTAASAAVFHYMGA